MNIPIGVLAKFPVLQITFYNSYNGKDVVVDVRPDSYFKDVGGGKRTNGIRPSEPGDPGSILGQSFLGSVVALFNREIGNLGLMSNSIACTQSHLYHDNNNPVTPNNPSKPIDPNQPKAANIDCASFVPQSKSAQNAIDAKFATSSQAITFCENTIATACTQNEASNLASGNVTALPTLCRLQYAQYVEALASGVGATLAKACKNLIAKTIFQTLINRVELKKRDLDNLIEEDVLADICNSLNCSSTELNQLILETKGDTSNSECQANYTKFVNDVKACVGATSCFIQDNSFSCPNGSPQCKTPIKPSYTQDLYCCINP